MNILETPFDNYRRNINKQNKYLKITCKFENLFLPDKLSDGNNTTKQ